MLLRARRAMARRFARASTIEVTRAVSSRIRVREMAPGSPDRALEKRRAEAHAEEADFWRQLAELVAP